MAPPRKRKRVADLPTFQTSTKASPKASPKSSRKTRRERAPHIRNWLAFIRPHADRYEALPRGEQRKLIEQLVKASGSSENTLRRYIAAARALEAHGIRELPAGRRYLPVASIEAIERIGKNDPARRRELFAALLNGMAPAATHRVKAELAERRKRAKRGDRKDGPAPAAFSSNEIIERVCDLSAQDSPRMERDQRSLAVVRFDEVAKGRGFHLFARPAAPRYAVMLPSNRCAVVFDEGTLTWTGGPALIIREFLRNIAIAVAIFDYVVVLCDTLQEDAAAIVAEMPQGCRDRIVVTRGRFDPKS